MATSERTTTKMIVEIAAFAAVTYMSYVYLGQSTAMLFGVLAIVVTACPEKMIATQAKRQLKDGMLSVSTLFILGYTLACGCGIIIAVFTMAAALNAQFGI